MANFNMQSIDTHTHTHTHTHAHTYTHHHPLNKGAKFHIWIPLVLTLI